MENKRLLLATVLSLAILVGWSYFFAPEQQVEQAQAPAPQAQPAPQSQSAQPLEAIPGAAFTPASGKMVTVETPLYTARLFADGGVLQHFILKNYKTGIEPGAANIDLVSRQALEKAPLGLIWNGAPTWNRGSWSFEGSDLSLSGDQTGQLSFVCDIAGARLVRTLTFRADNYTVQDLSLIHI
jgi:YidC/Oxa1 family membrane protein insertase